MTLIEDIGETTIRILQKAFYYLLGVLIKAVELWVRISRKVNVYGIFERRGVELKDYVILESQFFMLVFLLAAIAFIFEFLSFKVYFFAALISGGPILFLLTNKIKVLFNEYPAYRDFFLSYISIAVFLILVKIIKPSVGFGMPYIHLFFLSIFLVIITWIFFRKRYGRDYTFGEVLEKKSHKVRVRFNYDIRAGVKPGRYLLDDVYNLKEGDTVRVRVERKALGMKGAVPVEILENLEGEDKNG